jgi:predicted ATPase
MAVYRATWAEQLPLHQLALLTEAYGNMRQADEGLRLLAAPWATDTRRGERYYEAEIYRLTGELLLAQEGKRQTAKNKRQTFAEVEACFRQALAVARLQQAKSLELRAAMSLVRLWQQCGAQARAQQVLADVYSWFTEGFDTKDLQEARALLEELPMHTTTSRKRHTVTEV